MTPGHLVKARRAGKGVDTGRQAVITSHWILARADRRIVQAGQSAVQSYRSSISSIGRPTEKQPLSIGECEVPANRLGGPILCLIAFHDQLGTKRHGVHGNALSDQFVRAPAFDEPGNDRVVGLRHFEMEPRMRIDHLPLHQRSPQLERFVDVEFSRERMMRPHGRRARSTPHTTARSPGLVRIDLPSLLVNAYLAPGRGGSAWAACCSSSLAPTSVLYSP